MERPEDDPIRHTQKVKERFDDLIEPLRSDVGKVGDPQAKALFETSAEVLGGLHQAFTDYEEEEAAWVE